MIKYFKSLLDSWRKDRETEAYKSIKEYVSSKTNISYKDIDVLSAKKINNLNQIDLNDTWENFEIEFIKISENNKYMLSNKTFIKLI